MDATASITLLRVRVVVHAQRDRRGDSKGLQSRALWLVARCKRAAVPITAQATRLTELRTAAGLNADLRQKRVQQPHRRLRKVPCPA